ncbi:MAG: hypothetical protein VXZ40_01035 [Nanoarchaeota archaeon]|nr:hypothetical protein [Nanoarchaeota archaeon]
MNKKLHYASLGNNVSLQSILELQRKICDFYRQYPGVNCMYSFSPKPTITLGSYHQDNKLHPKLNSEIMQQKPGETRTKNMFQFLRNNFDKTYEIIDNSHERPGGSTYNGPGQLSFFFNLDLKDSPVSFVTLKKFLDQSMIETLQVYRPDLKFKYGKQIDIYTKIDEERLKIASQGFRIATNESKVEHTRYGITFHLSEKSVEPFDSLILPCGIEPHEGRATSLENLIGGPVNQELFENKFLNIFSKKLSLNVDSSKIISQAIEKEFEEIEKKSKLK